MNRWMGLIGEIPTVFAAIMAVRGLLRSQRRQRANGEPVRVMNDSPEPRRIERKRRPDRWKGFVAGFLGSLVGEVAVMRYWDLVTENRGGHDPRRLRVVNPRPDTLDDISLTGQHYERGESPTSAMGRMIYERITGRQPTSPETRSALSYLVQWTMGGLLGALYGFARVRGPLLDIRGGLGLGISSWLASDEVGPSLLGFSAGPTAYPAELHGYGLGAHLVHGVVTALSAQLLRRLLP